MSLNWKWDDKMGECFYEDGRKDNLYQGNAFVIAIHEFENDTYQLAWCGSPLSWGTIPS